MPDHVPNTKLYNKNLSPPNNTCTVPDSIGGRISGEALIRESDGAWQWEPETPEPTPGLAPESVQYEPVPKPKPKSKPKEGNA